jgi:hypothetical protein
LEILTYVFLFVLEVFLTEIAVVGDHFLFQLHLTVNKTEILSRIQVISTDEFILYVSLFLSYV